MDRRKEFLTRVYIMLGAFVMIFLVLIIKAFYINVVEGDALRKKSKELYFKVHEVKAERGKILADDGSPLATSQPIFEIRMDTRAAGLTKELFNSKVDSLATCLSEVLYKTRSVGSIKNALKSSYKKGERYVLIGKNLDYEQMQTVKNFPLFRLGPNTGGIIIITENRREKPFKNFASRTVGLVRENAESIGLEKSFDEDLKGAEGRRVMRKIGSGMYMPVDGLEEILPRKGRDIYTTLNPGIQEISELSLAEALRNHEAESGCVIVMEVATGAIKSIANLAWNKNGDLVENYNYAIGKSTEPGSTIKLASLLALLEEGQLDTGAYVNLQGGSCKFFDRIMKDSKLHGVEHADLAYSFIQSSNVGISKLVNDRFAGNPALFIKYLENFGLTGKTGIEIEGEPKAFIKHPVKNKQQWYGTSLPWTSIGYEMQLTPLQLLTFYNAVANDGVLVKPYLVSAIKEGHTIIKRFDPKIVNSKIASSGSIAKAKELMKQVVERGTAKNIYTSSYSIAGKTGTAVSNYFVQGAEDKNYQASFVGYFPADRPVYSCAVVIYNPQRMGYYGAEAAAPVFRKIADRCMRSEFAKLAAVNVSPKLHLSNELIPSGDKGFALDFLDVFNYIGLPMSLTKGSSWIETTAGNEGIQMLNLSFRKNQMPDLRGMGLRDALYLMDAYGAKLIPHGQGKIKVQGIAPGTVISHPIVDLYLE